MKKNKEKQYVSDNAQLMSEWNWGKNNKLELNPQKITYGSGKKVWWVCAENHEWQSTINNRSKGNGCPYCAGIYVIKGQNDLLTANPFLAKEWNYEKNEHLTPNDVLPNSGKKVWWRCINGHEWQATINHRSNGQNCPYCSNKKVLCGYNDLKTINPLLAREWNYDKNGTLIPENVVVSTHKKVWWKCSQGHEWIAEIASRNAGSGCPYCAGQKVIEGYNDLQTVNPDLAKEWNFEKNSLTPKNVLPNSHQKVWWKCINGHEWEAIIGNRNKGVGCPYCSNHKVVQGYNDLQTMNPDLAKEWNYVKNILTPETVLPNSGIKVWWKCSKGHEWNSRIASRNRGIGCPICTSERKTSFPEYVVVYYLKKYGFEIIHSYRTKGYELDIFIPSLNIAVEYDGYYWHQNKTQKDLEKNKKCEKDGIRLFRIREGLPFLNDTSTDYIIQKDQKDLSKIVEKLLMEITGIDMDVNLMRDTIEIENLREHTEKESSLLFSNPTVINEWDYEKNGDLKPAFFLANSNKKVWWKCREGHEWQATIGHRNRGDGCPYCSGKYVIKGENDLLTINPILSKEWNYEKNSHLLPEDFKVHSGKKVWWKCIQGHEWQSTIYNRSKGYGCPYCAGRYAIKYKNDLQTLNPVLSEDWCYEKNNGLTPMDVMPNSGKKVWWKCKNGHEWQATIINRNKGSGCPECAKENHKKKNLGNDSGENA